MSNCYRQLHVRPRGVEIDSLSVGEQILELLKVLPQTLKTAPLIYAWTLFVVLVDVFLLRFVKLPMKPTF
jgi:hypothetical protein